MRTIRLLLLAVLIVAVPAVLVRAIYFVGEDRSARATCVHAAHGSRRRLFVDARLLGLWR